MSDLCGISCGGWDRDPLSTRLLHLHVAPCLGSLIIDAALGWECRWGYGYMDCPRGLDFSQHYDSVTASHKKYSKRTWQKLQSFL